jgi:hypothetical protein
MLIDAVGRQSVTERGYGGDMKLTILQVACGTRENPARQPFPRIFSALKSPCSRFARRRRVMRRTAGMALPKPPVPFRSGQHDGWGSVPTDGGTGEKSACRQRFDLDDLAVSATVNST